MSGHRADMWDWCDRCGLSAFQIAQDGIRTCTPPDAAELALRRLNAVVARAPLMRNAEQIIARLEDDGILP